MAVACVALGICVAVNAYEIFMRFFYSKSLSWIQDFTLLMMLWFIFPGMVKIANKGSDISVDLFVSKLPPNMQTVIKVIMDVMVALFSVFLFCSSINMFMLRIGQVKTVSQIPLNCYTLAITVSMFFMALVYIEKLVQLFRNRKDGE